MCNVYLIKAQLSAQTPGLNSNWGYFLIANSGGGMQSCQKVSIVEQQQQGKISVSKESTFTGELQLTEIASTKAEYKFYLVNALQGWAGYCIFMGVLHTCKSSVLQSFLKSCSFLTDVHINLLEGIVKCLSASESLEH